MKKSIFIFLALTLYGCDGNVSENKNIAKEVAENTSWPMEVEGRYKYSNSNDHGGIDQNVFGSIESSADSFILIDTLDSILEKGNISSGDEVIATIKPSEIDSEFYQVISIRKSRLE